LGREEEEFTAEGAGAKVIEEKSKK